MLLEVIIVPTLAGALFIEREGAFRQSTTFYWIFFFANSLIGASFVRSAQMRPKLESLIPPTFFWLLLLFWKWQGELMDEAVTFQSSKNLERINDSVSFLVTRYSANVSV